MIRPLTFDQNVSPRTVSVFSIILFITFPQNPQVHKDGQNKVNKAFYLKKETRRMFPRILLVPTTDQRFLKSQTGEKTFSDPLALHSKCLNTEVSLSFLIGNDTFVAIKYFFSHPLVVTTSFGQHMAQLTHILTEHFLFS